MKTYKVKNYKGNLVESLSKFQESHKNIKIVEVCESGKELKIKTLKIRKNITESISEDESKSNLDIWIGGYLANSEDYFRNGDAEELANEFLEDYDCCLSMDEIISEIEWAQKNAEVEH